MSAFTWIGAGLGCILAHCKVIKYDFDCLTTNEAIKQTLKKETVNNLVNSLACTFTGALVGLVTEMSFRVSVPSLVLFVTAQCATSDLASKLRSYLFSKLFSTKTTTMYPEYSTRPPVVDIDLTSSDETLDANADSEANEDIYATENEYNHNQDAVSTDTRVEKQNETETMQYTTHPKDFKDNESEDDENATTTTRNRNRKR